jgi:hypothetical protein
MIVNILYPFATHSGDEQTKKKWKNVVDTERLQVKILHMRIACWITKATDTH